MSKLFFYFFYIFFALAGNLLNCPSWRTWRRSLGGSEIRRGLAGFLSARQLRKGERIFLNMRFERLVLGGQKDGIFGDVIGHTVYLWCRPAPNAHGSRVPRPLPTAYLVSLTKLCMSGLSGIRQPCGTTAQIHFTSNRCFFPNASAEISDTRMRILVVLPEKVRRG
jgi:hypothetical protein